MYLRAISNTLRSRRFWVWQIGGAFIYAIPATIRLATGNIHLPILSMFMPPWVNPLRAAATSSRKFWLTRFSPEAQAQWQAKSSTQTSKAEPLSRKQKYLARLGGAWLQTAAWSLFQLCGLHAEHQRLLRRQPLRVPIRFST